MKVVGELLEILLGDLEIVLGDLGLFLLGLELLHGVAADVAHGDLGFLGVLLDLLGELLAALLGQLREDQADGAAVVLRIDAEIGRENGLLNGLEGGGVPRLDEQAAGIGRADGGDLVDGRVCAVILDGDAVKHGGIRLAGADGGQLLGQELAGALHSALKIGVFERHDDSSSI